MHGRRGRRALSRRLGSGRGRALRGLGNMKIQPCPTAAAINLKRLAAAFHARFPASGHDSDARHARFCDSGATGGPESPDSARRTSDRTAPRWPARRSPRARLFNGLIFVSCYALNWEKRSGSRRWIRRNFRIGCRLRTGWPRRCGEGAAVRKGMARGLRRHLC